MPRATLQLPDFELGNVPVTACSWYVALGQSVVEGDRLLEVLAGDITIDLAAPASGVLIERLIELDESLHTGQRLATIEMQ